MNPLLTSWSTPGRPILPRLPGASVTHLNLRGEITVDGAIGLFSAVRDARDDSIELEIDSGGGVAVPALGLFELLITHPHQVVATITGRASSAAAIVAMAADRRRIVAEGSVMLHRVSGPDSWRQPFDAIVTGIFATATDRPAHLVDAWAAGETTFTASQAVAAGLAHEIVELEVLRHG